jgi:hypothetical protein
LKANVNKIAKKALALMLHKLLTVQPARTSGDRGMEASCRLLALVVNKMTPVGGVEGVRR